MMEIFWSRNAALVAALAGLAAMPALADTRTIDLAGWQALGDFGDPANSSIVVNIGAGSTVTGFQYIDLVFSTDPASDSYLGDLVLSVNNDDTTGYLDWSPVTTQAGGFFGPVSGAYGDANGTDGPYGSTGSFVAASGDLFITSYLAYYAPPVGMAIESGTLRIEFTAAAVPEPGSYGLMALGALAVVAAARRRRMR